VESSELPKMKCEFSSCPEWDKCPFDHIFNGEVREKKGKISSIFICQNREKPHKYACNIFQNEKLFPPIEGNIRTGLIQMGGKQYDISYCPQCEKDSKNFIPIQDFVHSEFRSLLTQLGVLAEKAEEKRKEEFNDKNYQEDVYDEDGSSEIQAAEQDLVSIAEFDTVKFSVGEKSLISIPETDQPTQERKESSLEDEKHIYDFDLWIKIIDTEITKDAPLALNQVMKNLILLLAEATHYPENASISLIEIIESMKVKFTKASNNSPAFWHNILTVIKKHQPNIPYLIFSSLIVNSQNLSSLIQQLDDYCLKNLEKKKSS